PAPPRGLWRYRLDRRRALLGGATSEGGNVYAWCRQVLKLPGDAEVEAALAALPAAGHGLTVLPHWAGERAPGWRGDRVGVIAGLRLDTTALEITRAALEAVALRLALVYDLLAPCAAPAHTIVASGGALARSRVWTQITADALGHAAARLTVDVAAHAIATRGRFMWALAGGETPRTTYERLALPPFRERVDWRHTWVFFGDERAVPPDHAGSNYRMAHEALL